MTSTIERRIEALEERRRGDPKRIAVIHQRDDGTWPPEPSDAALVIAIRNFGCFDPSESGGEVL